MKTDNEHKGQGLGDWLSFIWLSLIGFGVVIAPILLAKNIPIYYQLFSEGSYAQIINSSSEYYNPTHGILLTIEVVVELLLFLASVWMVYLYFSKHYLFPKWFVAIVVFSLVYVPASAWAASIVFPDEPIFDPITIKELVQRIVYFLFFVPYMLMSRTVRATFVERRPT